MNLTEQQLAMLVQEEVTGLQIHNVGLALEISGRLDVDRLACAVAAVCAAHPLLRCRVELDQSTVPRVLLDLTSASDRRPKLTVHRTAAKPGPADLREVFDPRFDWRSESPFRAHLWVSGPEEASLLLVFHHAFFDGRSEVVFLEDLAAVYNSGDPSRVRSETSPAYTDDQQDADEFWRRHFASAPREQSLGRPVPLDVTYLTHTHEETLTREAAETVGSYARSRGLTEFSMWLGVTAVAVAQASGQHAAVVGSMALDPRFASSRAIGLTSVFVPVVVAAPTNRSIGDVSDEAQSRFYEAWQHCFTQLSRIARITALQRRGTGHPVTGVRLNVQYLGSTLHLDGALCHRVDIQPERSIMDLTIDVLRSADDVDGRTLRFTARADIFSREALAGFARSFTALASAALCAPDSPICELARAYECNESPVTAALQRSDLSSSPSPAGASLGIPRSACVMRGATATVDARFRRTTRHSLQRMVDERIAWLDAVGPDPLKVSYLAQRDVDRLAWFLACHARGDTYIPLDARWPAERKDAALAIVQPDVVVEAGHHAGARTDSGRRDSVSHLGDAAYITFTSGSTGSPKAIPTSRDGLWHIARTLVDKFQLDDRCTIVSVSQPSFDVSILDMTLAALVGGDWIDAPPESLLGANFDGEERLLVQATPTVLSSLLSDWPFPPERTTVVSGGEVLTAPLAEHILQTSCRLFNIYGPTELSVWTTLAEVLPGQPVSVGRPLPGRTVRLLGESLGRVVPGTLGELCISGVGLFSGYLAAPSDALVEDPYAAGRLIYRTGDYGVHDQHGNIVFAGRTDDQIKIRGQRAELSEVRWAVTDTQLCEEVAVKFEPPQDGVHALLSVYLTGLRCDPGELWTRLEARLPEYMLPDEIVVLKRLPRTMTDKIDVSALTSRGATVWRRTAAPCAVEGEQPTVVPSQLVDIWRSVLGSPSDGEAEDFYAAGGNSLSALTLVRRVQDAYRVKLDLKEFLRTPSLHRLHQLVQHGRPQDLMAPPAAPLTAGQRGRLAYRRQTTTSAESTEGDMLRLVYRLGDGVEVEAVREAWSALVERHDALRCYVADEGVQSTVGASARFEVMRVGRPDEVPTAFTTVRFRRTSTSTMTMVRTEGPGSSAYLCIGLNRLFVDGASVSVIKGDLSGMLRGQPPSDPAGSWLHWCVEQSTADRGAGLAALRSELAGRPLSGGFPDRSRTSSSVRSRMFTGTSCGVVDPPGPDAPVGATREPAVSVLIAAAAAAHKVFGEPVWQIGMLFANRQDNSAAVAVGNFSNVVPVILPPGHRGPLGWDIALARASGRQGLPLATAYQVLEPSSYPFPWRQPQLLLSVTYGAEEAGDEETMLLEADCRLPTAVEPSASLFVHASLGRTGRVSVLTEGAEGVYSAGECSDFASALVGEMIAQGEGS